MPDAAHEPTYSYLVASVGNASKKFSGGAEASVLLRAASSLRPACGVGLQSAAVLLPAETMIAGRDEMPAEGPFRAAFSARVRAQLVRICQSEWFARSGRMRRFLEFVIEETLGGRAAQLCEYAIGVSVFNQGESFEPGMNPIVRNDARRLRQKLHEYYREHRPEPGDLVIEIPKGGYLPIFDVPVSRWPREPAPQRIKIRLTGMRNGIQLWTRECEGEVADSLEIQVSLDHR